MKILIFFLGLISATFANEVDNSLDLKTIKLCATLNNVYRTFANIWEVYNEFKATGQLWVPVATSACPVTPIDCTALRPVCAVTSNNFFKTFPNQCVLEAEQNATGTVWTIVFNGVCSTNPADGFVSSNNGGSAQQTSNNGPNINNDAPAPIPPPQAAQSSSIYAQNQLQNLRPGGSVLVDSVKEQKTPLKPSPLPDNYRQVYAQSEINRDPLATNAYPPRDISTFPVPRYSNSGQRQTLSQKYFALSPGLASYNQDWLQFRPPQANLSSSTQLTGYRNKVKEIKPSPAYAPLSPVPANYVQIPSQIESDQAPIDLYAPGPKRFNPVEEQQPTQKYPVPNPVSDNGNRYPPQSLRYHNSLPQSQPSPTYGVSSPNQLPSIIHPQSQQSLVSLHGLPEQATSQQNGIGPGNYYTSLIYPAPSPNVAVYNKGYPPQLPKVSTSEMSGYQSSANGPQPSPTYSAPPSDPSTYDQNSLQSQPQQVLLPSPACSNSSQSERPSPGYSVPSYAASSYNPVENSQPSSRYSVSTSSLENYDRGSPQPNRKQEESSSCPSNSPALSSVRTSADNSQQEKDQLPLFVSLLYNVASSATGSRNYNSEKPAPEYSAPAYYDGIYLQDKAVQPSPLNDVPENYNSIQSPKPSYSSPVKSDYNQGSPQYQAKQTESPSCPSLSLEGSVASNSAREPLPLTIYPVPSPIPSSNAQISIQYQSKQASLSTSYDDPTLQVSGTSMQESQNPANYTAPPSLPQSCGSASVLSSEASNSLKESGNSPGYSAPSPNAAAEYYNLANEPEGSPIYPESPRLPQAQPEQVALASYSPSSANGNYNNDQQIASDPTPCGNAVENQNLSSQYIPATSDQAVNNSYSVQPNDAGSTNQNNQDETPTIYNGVVYQGPYYYEPKYKHVNYGNFNFLPAQNSVIETVPSPNSVSMSIPDPQNTNYSTNPFEQLLKQLQYIASKNDKSAY